MAFHVEISLGFRRARAFNLDEARMRAAILDPWIGGRIIRLGDRDWEPKDCTLVILEGPELADSDLSMGRGWSNAERSAENVTRRLVDAAASPVGPVVAVVADRPETEAEIRRLLERLELETAAWAELRSRILSPPATASGARYAAVLASDSAEPTGAWLFDVGLARGALGPRAVLAQLGDASIPPQLADLDPIRLVADDEDSLRALQDRLSG
ncbi:MAG: hypothetical protein WBV53_04390 [Solirubrobacterales bacterium]